MKKTTAAWQPIFVFSLFLILLSIFFYLKKPSNKTTANNILQAIPQKDKKILNRFFNQLMFQDSFVFILFGTKPMGTAVFNQFIPNYLDNQINRSLKQGWTVWTKYANLFPQPNFIFRIVGDLEEDRFIKIILANKKNLGSLFESHQNLYETLVQRTFSHSYILEQLAANSHPLQDCFAGNHVLIGLAHGFGLHNSQRFQTRLEAMNELQQQHHWIAPDDLLAELDKHGPKMILLEDHSGSPIRLPIFAIDPDSQETHQLIEQYLAERQMIEDLYQEGDFLEITLEKLIADD